DAVLGLAILAVAVRVVSAAQDDRPLVSGRGPFLDLPRAGLLRVGEVEVKVERADVGLVANLAGLLLGVGEVDCDRAVVAGGVMVGERSRRPEARREGERHSGE